MQVKFHDKKVGTLSLTADKKCCAFEYDSQWLTEGFSISPLELPLTSGLFVARPNPFNGNFGIFEDSLPDGYGRYLLHKALLKIGINDFELSALDRLSLVGNGGMGALTYEPETFVERGSELQDFELLQEKPLRYCENSKTQTPDCFCTIVVIVVDADQRLYFLTKRDIGLSNFAILMIL